MFSVSCYTEKFTPINHFKSKEIKDLKRQWLTLIPTVSIWYFAKSELGSQVVYFYSFQVLNLTLLAALAAGFGGQMLLVLKWHLGCVKAPHSHCPEMPEIDVVRGVCR